MGLPFCHARCLSNLMGSSVKTQITTVVCVHAQEPVFYRLAFSVSALVHGMAWSRLESGAQLPLQQCLCAGWLQSYNPMDCSPPGSSIRGILQARTLEWVDISSARGSSWPRDPTRVSCVSWVAGATPGSLPTPTPALAIWYQIWAQVLSSWMNSVSFTSLSLTAHS